MKIGIHEAKTKLSKLIPVALSGEEVIITKSGKPLVKLVPVEAQKGERPLGCYSGKITFAHDILNQLPDEIIDPFWNAQDDETIPS